MLPSKLGADSPARQVRSGCGPGEKLSGNRWNSPLLRQKWLPAPVGGKRGVRRVTLSRAQPIPATHLAMAGLSACRCAAGAGARHSDGGDADVAARQRHRRERADGVPACPAVGRRAEQKLRGHGIGRTRFSAHPERRIPPAVRRRRIGCRPADRDTSHAAGRRAGFARPAGRSRRGVRPVAERFRGTGGRRSPRRPCRSGGPLGRSGRQQTAFRRAARADDGAAVPDRRSDRGRAGVLDQCTGHRPHGHDLVRGTRAVARRGDDLDPAPFVRRPAHPAGRTGAPGRRRGAGDDGGRHRACRTGRAGARCGDHAGAHPRRNRPHRGEDRAAGPAGGSRPARP